MTDQIAFVYRYWDLETSFQVVALMQSMQSQLERERQRRIMEDRRVKEEQRKAEEQERERVKAEKRAAKVSRFPPRFKDLIVMKRASLT